MVCKNCYYNNEGNSKFCVKCGAKLEPEVIVQNTSYNNVGNMNSAFSGNEIVNYSPASAIIALVVSLCCCSNIFGIIFSILALVEGGKVNPFIQTGNIQSAKASLAQYKKWTKYAWISTAIWAGVIILIYVLYFIFIFGIVALSEY